LVFETPDSLLVDERNECSGSGGRAKRSLCRQKSVTQSMGGAEMTYDMQAEGINGVNSTTFIVPVNWPPFNGPGPMLLLDTSNGVPPLEGMTALTSVGWAKGPGLIGLGGSSQGAGVVGVASNPNPTFIPMAQNAGVLGIHQGSGLDDIGVRGENDWKDGANLPQGRGVGVLGTVQLQKGVGVRGENTASATQFGPAIAVVGESSVGTGVQGVSHGFSGIGVEGLANDGAEGTGVHGQANGANGAGVLAQSDEGTAIVGLSTHGVGGVFSAGAAGVQSGDAPPGRAGVFGSDSAAQVRLVPHKPLSQPALNQAYSVQVLISKGLTAEFPANGQAGDLLCTTVRVRNPSGGTVEVGTLWFCEKGGTNKTNPAQWRQVLLGPAFSGGG
jgi:hypothetical protein